MTAVHCGTGNELCTHVDVKYVLAGNELSVDKNYIKEYKIEVDDSGGVKSGRRSKRARKSNLPTESNDETTSKKCTKKAKKEPSEPISISDEKKKKIRKKNSPVARQEKKAKIPIVPKVTPSSIKRSLAKDLPSEGTVTPSDLDTCDAGKSTSRARRVSTSPIEDAKAQNRRAVPKTNPLLSQRTKLKSEVGTNVSRSKLAANSKSGVTDDLSLRKIQEDRSYPSIEDTMKENWDKAAKFVNEVVGSIKETTTKKQNSADSACSLSQSSEASMLELESEEERASIFNAILNGTSKIRREGCMQIDELQSEITKTIEPDVKDFSKLEVHTLLKKLERRDKIMVTWDTGTIYTI